MLVTDLAVRAPEYTPRRSRRRRGPAPIRRGSSESARSGSSSTKISSSPLRMMSHSSPSTPWAKLFSSGSGRLGAVVTTEPVAVHRENHSSDACFVVMRDKMTKPGGSETQSLRKVGGRPCGSRPSTSRTGCRTTDLAIRTLWSARAAGFVPTCWPSRRWTGTLPAAIERTRPRSWPPGAASPVCPRRPVASTAVNTATRSWPSGLVLQRRAHPSPGRASQGGAGGRPSPASTWTALPYRRRRRICKTGSSGPPPTPKDAAEQLEQLNVVLAGLARQGHARGCYSAISICRPKWPCPCSKPPATKSPTAEPTVVVGAPKFRIDYVAVDGLAVTARARCTTPTSATTGHWSSMSSPGHADPDYPASFTGIATAWRRL